MGNSKIRRASAVVRTTATGQQQALRLPAQHYFNNLSLDAKNRLYVTASSKKFDEATGEPLREEKTNTAILYISRQPLP